MGAAIRSVPDNLASKPEAKVHMVGGMPSHSTLSKKYPSGLMTEAQLVLKAGDAAKAMDLADDIGFCLGIKGNREAMERLGRKQQLPVDSPLADAAEAARTEAFCQTMGPQGQVLQQQLLRRAAADGQVRAVVRVHREQLDPGQGTAH